MSGHLIERNSSLNVKRIKQDERKSFDSISIKFQGSFQTIGDVFPFETAEKGRKSILYGIYVMFDRSDAIKKDPGIVQMSNRLS